MLIVEHLRVDDKVCLGVRIDLPDSPPLLVAIAGKGFVMCGFLNTDTAERLGVVAAMVSGVRSFDDVLSGEIKAVTSKAEALGIKASMTGIEALKCMF